MRKEKYSEQLQSLPKKFLVEAATYFKEKKDFLQALSTIFGLIVYRDMNESMRLRNLWNLYADSSNAQHFRETKSSTPVAEVVQPWSPPKNSIDVPSV